MTFSPKPQHLTTAPTLTTARLRLRATHADDLPNSLSFWGDETVVRQINVAVQSREEVWARLLRQAGHWALLGYGYWIVEERASETYIGEVGFSNYMRTLDGAALPAPEVGWGLKPAFHGKGYALEAVTAALDWFTQENGPTPFHCMIDPGNNPSIALAGKLGFSFEKSALYKNAEVSLYRRPA